MNVTIRAARPDDAEPAVPLIYSSGPACFDYAFSHRTPLDAKEYLRRVFPGPKGEFGYAVHTVAELDGEVVATGAAFDGRRHLEFTMAALRGIFGHYGVGPALGVVRRGLQVESIVKPPKGDLHYIAHIGVAPDLRGSGIGTRIMEHLIDAGRALGRSTAALDVSCENPRAEALYERLGFRVTEEVQSRFENETARIPNHRRMELPL